MSRMTTGQLANLLDKVFDLKKLGYIWGEDGCYYTEQDILDGKCSLNNTLVNMGYIKNSDGTWRKE